MPSKKTPFVFYRRRVALFAASTVMLGLPLGAHAQSTAQADAAVIALDQKNCEAATDALNQGMANNEPKSFFIAGQLFEYGICLPSFLAQ